MIGVEVRDGWYIVRIDKAVLVMSKADFVQCLRRGKWWRRRQAMAARLAVAVRTEDTKETPYGTDRQTRGTRAYPAAGRAGVEGHRPGPGRRPE